MKHDQLFLSASHKYRINYSWNVQYGIDHSRVNYHYDEVKPLHYYAMGLTHPTISEQENTKFTATELYAYTDYKFSNRIGVSLGIRKNILYNETQVNFLSNQFSAFYKINAFHRFIFGLGNYNSYTTPNYYEHKIGLLSSKQIALDYYYEKGNTFITGAVYLKKDKGSLQLSAIEQISDQHILGVEWSFNQSIGRFLSFAVSSSVLKREQYIDQERNKNWMYFVKGQITYSNPKFFTASMVCATHTGERYTQLNTAFFDAKEDVFIPLVTAPANEKLNQYFRMDVTINKLFPLGKNYLVVYSSIANLLNRKNYKVPYYNEDYSHVYFQNFQRRVLYFGLQFKF